MQVILFLHPYCTILSPITKSVIYQLHQSVPWHTVFFQFFVFNLFWRGYKMNLFHFRRFYIYFELWIYFSKRHLVAVSFFRFLTFIYVWHNYSNIKEIIWNWFYGGKGANSLSFCYRIFHFSEAPTSLTEIKCETVIDQLQTLHNYKFSRFIKEDHGHSTHNCKSIDKWSHQDIFWGHQNGLVWCGWRPLGRIQGNSRWDHEKEEKSNKIKIGVMSVDHEMISRFCEVFETL